MSTAIRCLCVGFVLLGLAPSAPASPTPIAMPVPTDRLDAARDSSVLFQGKPARREAESRRGKKSKNAPPRLDPFVGKLDDALAQANERNVPLVILLAMEDEPENLEFRRALLPDPKLAAALVGTVTVLTNDGEHAPVEIEVEVDGTPTPRKVCGAYFTPTCADHAALWKPVFARYNENGELRCPQAILVAPDKKTIERVQPGHVPKLDELVAAIEAAKKRAGVGLSVAELASIKQSLEQGELALRADDAPLAWRSYEAALQVNDRVSWAEQAREGKAKAQLAIVAARDRAVALLASETPVLGYDELVLLAERCKGLPHQRELEKLVADARKAPATKDAISAALREREAAVLWREARALAEQGDEKKALAPLRKLLRAYADTECGQVAAKAHPRIAEEEAAEVMWAAARDLEKRGDLPAAQGRLRTLLRKHRDTPAGERAAKAYPDLAKEVDEKRG